MKILIVSDTHGQHKSLVEIVEAVEPIDMLIHLGDVEGGENYIRGLVECETHIVAGNNDFFSKLNKEEEFFIGKYRVFICHGHNYLVSLGPERIREFATERSVDIIMYGHTHKPYLEIGNDLTVLNPGSVSLPRQEGRKPSFIIMDTDKNGEAHYTINYC